MYFWNTHHIGFRGSGEKMCPRDGQQGCAIVDVLDECDADEATQYLSWCWAYKVEQVLASLRTWHDAKTDQSIAALSPKATSLRSDSSGRLLTGSYTVQKAQY